MTYQTMLFRLLATSRITCTIFLTEITPVISVKEYCAHDPACLKLCASNQNAWKGGDQQVNNHKISPTPIIIPLCKCEPLLQKSQTRLHYECTVMMSCRAHICWGFGWQFLWVLAQVMADDNQAWCGGQGHVLCYSCCNWSPACPQNRGWHCVSDWPEE